MQWKKAALLIFLSLWLLGCTYGNTIYSEVTPIGNSHLPTSDVEIYFGEYNGDYKYEQIAYIRVVGRKYSKTPELLEELKARAKSMGADAVINLKTSDTERESGSVAESLIELASTLDSVEYEPPEKDRYMTLVLDGVAVKYTDM